MKYLDQIAVFLGTTTSCLLTGTAYREQGLTDREQILLELFRNASGDMQEAVMAVLRAANKKKREKNDG